MAFFIAFFLQSCHSSKQSSFKAFFLHSFPSSLYTTFKDSSFTASLTAFFIASFNSFLHSILHNFRHSFLHSFLPSKLSLFKAIVFSNPFPKNYNLNHSLKQLAKHLFFLRFQHFPLLLEYIFNTSTWRRLLSRASKHLVTMSRIWHKVNYGVLPGNLGLNATDSSWRTLEESWGVNRPQCGANFEVK